MKRLRKYLLSMDPKNSTYNDMYEGPYYVPELDETLYDPTYWRDDVSYTISRTHKLTLDKPSIEISIPFLRLSLTEKENHLVTADFALREFNSYIDELNAEIYNRSRPDKENGVFYSYKPTGEVLLRNACCVSKNSQNECYLKILIMAQLPLKNHRKAMRMLCNSLPDAVDAFILNFKHNELDEAIQLYTLQEKIRQWLKTSEYCSFIANGSILPRNKGTQLPQENAVPFKSPKQDEIEIFGIKGMGIRCGVTVITGGGYSGKSTFLDAISAGIFNHIIGDGRELIITDDTAVEISAEDGRAVQNVDLSPFIKWLPNGDTAHFSTTHASGSTSQAANIMEAVNYGSKLLLIDEDKSATNFMIRDKLMKVLIKTEPITPFTGRVNQLFTDAGVSTILVIGGSGEYMSIADNVIMMDEFIACNATAKAKALSGIADHLDDSPNWNFDRQLHSKGFTSYPNGSGTEKLVISDMGFILIGDEKIDIRMLHNIVGTPQLNAIGFILRHIMVKNNAEIIDIKRAIYDVLEKIKSDGLDSIYSTFFLTDRWLELPRFYEICAVISRMRNIEFLNGMLA
ncbi:P-loop domain-containing protein [Proteiniborus sp. MB09-C3]|uniref:P-loop domain-containing protein n=1 Tax=Proteiniborus sp. MB09-C3 TaxID=3050072 RepID=UPI002554A5C6|nr:P-loop domain-containing protein [Proteiniborus sp. MB09-C3]WIV13686.1 ABC-ATPase domain-containing protein [Proteiniborus sp. MB09-C3]